jgi:two-component system, cell cycle sensor histidine kinase and response regulator CckA
VPRYAEGSTESLVGVDAGGADMLSARHGTILVVEDEPALLHMSRVMLERLGYRVWAVASPNEAIALANEHADAIDLLMTDVVMPEMNGRELVERITSQHPHMKYLFMSGYTANVIAQHGVLNSDIPFLQKPFSRRMLAQKIWEVLEK